MEALVAQLLHRAGATLLFYKVPGDKISQGQPNATQVLFDKILAAEGGAV